MYVSGSMSDEGDGELSGMPASMPPPPGPISLSAMSDPFDRVAAPPPPPPFTQAGGSAEDSSELDASDEMDTDDEEPENFAVATEPGYEI